MRKSLQEAKAALTKTLDRSGYTKMKAKHGTAKRPDFPDLSTGDHRTRYPSSHGVGNGFARASAASHPDAKQFPVGNNHKQGPQLIVGSDDLSYLGGRKT